MFKVPQRSCTFFSPYITLQQLPPSATVENKVNLLLQKQYTTASNGHTVSLYSNFTNQPLRKNKSWMDRQDRVFPVLPPHFTSWGIISVFEYFQNSCHSYFVMDTITEQHGILQTWQHGVIRAHYQYMAPPSLNSLTLTDQLTDNHRTDNNYR